MKDKVHVFLDFEFTCPEQKGISKREIISMAAVFRYADGSPLTSFYSVVKPSRTQYLSARTIRLTGITQAQINKSQRFDKVAQKFLELVDDLSPSGFFVWGNADRIEVQKAVRFSHADKRMEKISDEFHDLQVDVMEQLGLPNPYNLERAADIYGIDFRHAFSAIDDAECLADIYFAYQKDDYDEEKLNSYKQFYKYRRVIGKYKLVKNNVKMAEKKLAQLKMKSQGFDENSDDYRKIQQKIIETSEYIKHQSELADKLEPMKDEAEQFVSECECL